MKRLLLRALLGASVVGTLATCAASVAGWSHCRAIDRSDALVDKAQRLGEEGRRAEALDAARAAAEAAPDNPRARREVAMHFLARGDLKAAIGELQAASAAAPRDAGLLIERAAAMDLAGDARGAIPLLRRAVKIAPNDGLAWSLLSGSLLKVGDLQGAVESGESAAAVAPGLYPAHFNLGLARWRAGDRVGALPAFQNAIRLQPSDPSAIICTAAVLSELDRHGEALQYARRAVAAAPDSSSAWASLGSALLRGGDREAAEAAFFRARELGPRPGESHIPPPAHPTTEE